MTSIDVNDLLDWVNDPTTVLGQLHQRLQDQKTLDIGTIELQAGDASNIIRCSRCKTPDPIITARQTRSADEGMSIFYECSNPECGHKWKER